MISSKFRPQVIPIFFHASLWLWSTFTLTERAQWDVNPHHDGVILAPAIAVSEGKVPNLEVFSQYGFLIPYIQGTVLKFTSASLINLRYFAVAQVVLTAVLLFYVLHKFVSYPLSSLLSVSWLISFPHLLPFLPWPSVTSTLLIVIGMALLLRIKDADRNRNLELIWGFLAFFLAALIRPQVSLILLLLFYYAIFIRSREVINRLKTASLIIFFPLIIVAISYFTGSLFPYLEQSIFWAGGNYTGIGFNLRGILELTLVPLFGGLVFLGLYLTLKIERKSLSIIYWIFLSTLSIIFLKFFSWTYQNYPYVALKHPKILFANLGWNTKNTLSYFIFTWLLLLVFLKLKNFRRNSLTDFNIKDVIFAISALSILQLYPATDPLHFWWVTPIFLIGTFLTFKPDFDVKIHFRYLVFPLLAFIFVCSFDFLNDQSKNRVEYRESTLRGMSGFPSEVSFIDETFRFLESRIGSTTLTYECADGLYSTGGGLYNLANSSYVDWSPEFVGVTKATKYIFQCNVPKDSPFESGFRLVDEVDIRSGEFGLYANHVNRLIGRGIQE